MIVQWLCNDCAMIVQWLWVLINGLSSSCSSNKLPFVLPSPPIPFLQNRCLTYETSSREAEPEARSCSSNAQNQQWKLKADNTLRPRNDESKCLFLIELEETREASFHDYGFKVLPCSSSYNNKRFTFEYLSHQISGENKLHTFFKLKAKNDNFDHEGWQGQDICLAFRARRGYVGTLFERWVPEPFRCTCPSIRNELHGCIGESPPWPSDNEYPWFKFEPVE